MKGRICNRCNKYKEANEFWKVRGKLRGICKECYKNIDTRKIINCKDCGKKIKRKSKAHKYCDSCAKERDKISVKKSRAEHPERKRAQKTANYYIKIPKGMVCQKCGKNKALDKHHPDYSKPLIVEFLCKKCHKQADRERRENEPQTKGCGKDLDGWGNRWCDIDGQLCPECKKSQGERA